MRQEQIARDLGRKIRDRIQEQLECDVDLARRVLGPQALMGMLCDLASGMSSAVALVAIQLAQDGVDAEDVYEQVVAAVALGAREMRVSSQAKLARELEARR